MYFNNPICKFLLAFASILFASNEAHAFGGYQKHEYPFKYIGSQYSQPNGDAYCRQVYKDLGGYNITVKGKGGTGGVEGGANGEGSVIFAADGTPLNGANHVWYHQINGECVANK